MSSVRLYLVVLAVWWCAAGAAGAPRHDRHKKHALHVRKRNSDSSSEQLTIELPQVLNQTVCAIERVLDHDANRVPQTIKMLKCAPQPSQVCRREDVRREQACCGQKHESFNTQCVEVLDHVVVKYLSGEEPRLRKISVSVGCSCMIRPKHAASDDD